MSSTGAVIERELYLIRHGQSLGNIGAVAADAAIEDREDSPLSPLGLSQAEQLGRHYAQIAFDAVYSSGLLRAVMTAAGLLRGQAAQLPLQIEPLLTEIGMEPGYPGRNRAALAEVYQPMRFPPAEAPILCSNDFHDEAAAFARARRLLEQLFAQYRNGEKIALISHAGFLTFILFELIGYHDHQPFDFKLSNTGVTHVLFYRPGTYPYGDMVFACVNDRTHLAALPSE